jgi:two-component sensor histidine kinase
MVPALRVLTLSPAGLTSRGASLGFAERRLAIYGRVRRLLDNPNSTGRKQHFRTSRVAPRKPSFTCSSVRERKRTLQRQELLIRKMDHRIKNLFALAISVLSLRGRSATSVPQLIESAGARLTALARAHALTLAHGRPELPHAAGQTTLHSLIEAIFAPHLDERGGLRFSVVGCDPGISGPAISSLALLLHEFATNLVKYGALSSSVGQTQIHFAEKAGTVIITRSESGGPIVAARIGDKGFGDLLVRTTVTGQLGGEITWDWRSEGLVLRLSVPRERLTT